MDPKSSIRRVLKASLRVADEAVIQRAPRGLLSERQRLHRDGWRSRITDNLGLSPHDRVADIGAYLGDWAFEIREQYDYFVDAYEPVPEFAEALMDRFRADSKVKVFPFGIGAQSEFLPLIRLGDATFEARLAPEVSIHDSVLAEIRSAREVLPAAGPYALASINIEGAEYLLLESMLSDDLFQYVRKLLIQFHRIAPNRSENLQLIHTARESLGTAYRCDWSYEFLWELWSDNQEGPS